MTLDNFMETIYMMLLKSPCQIFWCSFSVSPIPGRGQKGMGKYLITLANFNGSVIYSSRYKNGQESRIWYHCNLYPNIIFLEKALKTVILRAPYNDTVWM